MLYEVITHFAYNGVLQMELIQHIVGQINGVVWGVPMLVMILGIGIYLNIGLKFMPLFNIGRAFKLLWGGRKSYNFV